IWKLTCARMEWKKRSKDWPAKGSISHRRNLKANRKSRAGLSFRVSPDDFALAAPSAVFRIQSSGTRNSPVETQVSLEWLAVRTLAVCVFLDAHALFSHAHAMYDAVLPASGGINNLLMYNRAGVAVERWFAREVPDDRGRHYLATYTMALAA